MIYYILIITFKCAFSMFHLKISGHRCIPSANLGFPSGAAASSADQYRYRASARRARTCNLDSGRFFCLLFMYG